MLSLIIGKPGSGKSYLAVKRLARELCDWAEYAKRQDTHIQRKVYTNIKLDMDAISSYVREKTSTDFHAQDYIQHLEPDFFFLPDGQKKEWWKAFDEGAYIIIDEVQSYLPADSISSDKRYLEAFRLYISQHRHYKHDLVFITQHTDTIQKSILCMAESAYHVVNLKAQVMPILKIPFSDLSVVKEAWGYTQQYAKVLYGTYIGRAFRRESTLYELLQQEIYDLYKSHTLSSGQAEDRPSLRLSRLGSLVWLFRRHWLHLTVKAVSVVLVVYLAARLLVAFPTLVSKAFATGFPTPEKKLEAPAEMSAEPRVNAEKTVGKPSKKEDIERQSDTKVIGYMSSGVITPDGIIRVGESLVMGGKKRTLTGVSVRYGTVKTVASDTGSDSSDDSGMQVDAGRSEDDITGQSSVSKVESRVRRHEDSGKKDSHDTL